MPRNLSVSSAVASLPRGGEHGNSSGVVPVPLLTAFALVRMVASACAPVLAGSAANSIGLG
eukprot:scaffold754_cov248-Pinguiococcus_pyrenoidosus.AAC.30